MEIIRKRPVTWAKLRGIIIYDPDGWRSDKQSFYKPVTEDEFNRRMMLCTIMHTRSLNLFPTPRK
jgi:hypothetical protein